MIAFPILRTRGVYMVLATFAFAEVVSGLTINMEFLGRRRRYASGCHAPVTVLVIAAICCYPVQLLFHVDPPWPRAAVHP